jgi:hypothetical protein
MSNLILEQVLMNMSVKNKLKEGSVFSFSLPLADVQ